MQRTPIGEPDSLLGGRPAVRAGDFVFLSGHLAREVEASDLLYRSEAQTEAIFQSITRTLEAAGTSPARLAKLQTFHRNLDEFAPHLAARKRALAAPLPPSTAVEAPLPAAGADVLINGIAVAGDTTLEVVEVEGVPRPLGPYSQAVVAAPFVFLAGVLASDFRTGVAPEARVDPALPHFGSPIKAQTTFVLDTISRLLEGSGSSLDRIVKAQVILTDMADFWGFEEVWRSYFSHDPPARTVVEGGLVNPGCIVEVDVVALTAASGLAREIVSHDGVARSPLAESPAVRAGDWLFLGGCLPTDYATGVDPAARIDPNFPRYQTAVNRQSHHVLDSVEALLDAGGASPGNLVSLWGFVAGGPDEFRGVRQVLADRLGDDPPAMTVAGSGRAVVPGCQLVIDGIAVVS